MQKDQTKTRYEILLDKAREVIIDTIGWIGIRPEVSSTPYELILESSMSEVLGTRLVFRVSAGWAREGYITEMWLQPQDVFVFDRWGLFLLNTDDQSDITFLQHTFPDADYFEEDILGEAEIFYKSQLSLVMNNEIILPGFCTDRFRSMTGARERSMDMDSDSGLIDVGTALLLVGSRNMRFNLDLPREARFVQSGRRLRLRLNGILIRNAVVID